MRDSFAKKFRATGVLTRLDARTKLTVTLACAVLTVACSGLVSQLALFAVTLTYALFLKRPVMLALLYALMGVMMLMALGFGMAASVWIPAIGGVSINALVIPFLRALCMMNVVMVLAMTTRIEDLMTTLESMKMPFCIFLPTTVMLRFIPTFTHDVRQIWETLKIRGWPMNARLVLLRPILCARLLLTPLLFRALKSSETLGVASELKGLGVAKRTLLTNGQTLTSLDARVFAVTFLTTVMVVLAEVFLRQLWMTSGVGMV